MGVEGRSDRGRGERFRVAVRFGFLPFVVTILAGILAGLSGATFHYGEGGSYFSPRPESCVNCHVMQDHFDSWIKSSHQAVATCADCHLPHDNKLAHYAAKADNGFFHSWAFTFQDFEEPIRIKPRNLRILQQSCVRCHGAMVHEMLPATRGGEAVSCMHCHGDVGHALSR